MKKNGFTLIELLAVIVILAIIALIATPAVLNIIEDSRKGAAEASARNIINAAKTYYMSETMKGNTPSNIDLSTDTLKYDGDQATKGTITFEDGEASGKMYVGGYCVEVGVNGAVSSDKMEEDDCVIGTEGGQVTPEPEPAQNPYADGTPFLYDPVNNAKCETSIGSSIGTNDGCMKWYAFLTDEASETVNLILDHNTTDYSEWSGYDETTPTTANSELQNDITNWNEEVKTTARLITAQEVTQIAPTAADFTWTETDSSTSYYLHTGTKTSYTGEVGSNKYAWLFDNTNGCETYGCNAADSGTNGYWTSTYAGFEAWRVSKNGMLSTYVIDYDISMGGIRPVITVSKSVFE